MPVTQATPFRCSTCSAEYKLVRVETKDLFRISRYHVENAVANYPAPKVVLFSNTFHWLIAPGGGLVVAILTRPSPN